AARCGHRRRASRWPRGSGPRARREPARSPPPARSARTRRRSRRSWSGSWSDRPERGRPLRDSVAGALAARAPPEPAVGVGGAEAEAQGGGPVQQRLAIRSALGRAFGAGLGGGAPRREREGVDDGGEQRAVDQRRGRTERV